MKRCSIRSSEWNICLMKTSFGVPETRHGWFYVEQPRFQRTDQETTSSVEEMVLGSKCINFMLPPTRPSPVAPLSTSNTSFHLSAATGCFRFIEAREQGHDPAAAHTASEEHSGARGGGRTSRQGDSATGGNHPQKHKWPHLIGAFLRDSLRNAHACACCLRLFLPDCSRKQKVEAFPHELNSNMLNTPPLPHPPIDLHSIDSPSLFTSELRTSHDCVSQHLFAFICSVTVSVMKCALMYYYFHQFFVKIEGFLMSNMNKLWVFTTFSSVQLGE